MNFEAYGRVESRKMRKFVLRTALRPNQIEFSHSLGPRPTPRGLRAASPLTEVHRPRARQAVDVVGAPAYDPEPTEALLD